MRTVYQVCCGIDVHKKNLVACLIAVDEEGHEQRTSREYATVTQALLELADWLTESGCSHVAMESTGVYWKPVVRHEVALESEGVKSALQASV
jgi:transposase